MYATNLINIGIQYLGDLQLDSLYQLQDELDQLWKNGQSTVPNSLYDKVVDGINYEITKLKSNPYTFAITKTDNQLKNMVAYFNQLHSQGKSPIDNTTWDILDHELTMRNMINTNSSTVCPPHWKTMSLDENPVELVTLARSSQEFQNLSKFFSKSLQQSSVVVYSIIRIQNLRLWSIFQELKNTIVPNNIERLFHGTASLEQQKLIIHHGFYHSFCPGGLIGDGIYFAVNSNYSNNDPYVLRRTNHRRELFICQVLLGHSSQGGSSLKSPAPGCHSVFHLHDNQNDMFCIFNTYQAYPEYIVQYDYQ